MSGVKNGIFLDPDNNDILLVEDDLFGTSSFDSRSYMSDMTFVREESLQDDDTDNSESLDDDDSQAVGLSWRRFSRRQVFIFGVFSVTNFFAATAFSIMAPFYPAEAERKGASATEYGMVFGVFELVAFVASPIFGKYLYILGPKRTFIIGVLITGSATALFGVLDEIFGPSFLVFSFLIRIIAAVGDAALITSVYSLVAAEFPKYVATTFATLETFFGLGLIVGPTLGGFLFELGGFKLPFLVAGGTTTLVGAIAAFVMPTERLKDDEWMTSTSLVKLLKMPSISLAAFSILTCALTLGFLGATLEPHVRQFGLTPVSTGLIFIIHGGIYGLTAPFWGWLSDKFISSTTLTLWGEVTIFVGFIFIGPVGFLPMDTFLWLTCVGLAIYGFGLGVTMVSTFIMALEEAVVHGFSDNIQTYGVISALWNSSFALGSFIGPSIGGFLLDQVGFRWATVFVLITQLIVITLFLALFFIRSRRSSGYKESTRYTRNLSDSTPLLLESGTAPCCSKTLDAAAAAAAGIESLDTSYGAGNLSLSKTFSSSSS